MSVLVTYMPRIVLFLIVIGWVYLFFFSSPTELISLIGTENGYVLISTASFISGLSIFGVAPYHLILIALASGGMNPFLLSLAAALGLALGDSTSYFIGYQGSAIIPERAKRIVERISMFFQHHEKTLPVYIFLYGALVPFSNDFVGVTMGLTRYPFWRVMVPLTLGTFVFNLTLSFLSVQAYDLIIKLFS